MDYRFTAFISFSHLCVIRVVAVHSITNKLNVGQWFCSYQEAIEDITKRMGAGMAKFICKEVCRTWLLFCIYSFH